MGEIGDVISWIYISIYRLNVGLLSYDIIFKDGRYLGVYIVFDGWIRYNFKACLGSELLDKSDLSTYKLGDISTCILAY